MQLVECVPNFSEGRDPEVIEAIAAAIRAADGVTLLDVDPGPDTNRTVVTFLGPPEAVLVAAFAAIATATERIDMRTHTGAHARMGACDVCPFVPVAGVSMAECVDLARRLGQRVGDELGLPVYLYEQAATQPERSNLAQVRKGEYEGLADKLADPAWKPDFGPAEYKPKSGATAIGAREFLIAYNFNLNTRDRKIAHQIALEIREAGRAKRDQAGLIIRDAAGRAIKKPGLFKHLKAVGWYMEDFGCAQVTMNLTNHKLTPLAEVFDAVCRLADERGVRVTGSELVGLMPEDCLLTAGRHFLRKVGKSEGVPRPELLRLAVQSLGLSELTPFDLDKKIVERCLPDKRALANLSLIAFADETSTDSPAPGGGSVAAACGALSAALAGMAANLTVGKKKYADVQDQMKAQAVETQVLKDFFLQAIDDDAASFDRVMDAFRLPKKTVEQKATRSQAIQKATKGAVAVPLAVLQSTPQVLALAEAAVAQGNANALSDAGVSGLCARTAAEGAYYNVTINLAGITDKAYVAETGKEAKAVLEDVRSRAEELGTRVRERLEKDI
jgi:glutamate formiminotransferase/formiminotetrahydrofolate cyclodeaminase